jgi:hypothetical protein
MAPPLQLRIVFEGRAVVQDPAVIDEEHLAALQVELRAEFGTARHAVQQVEGLDLGRGQRLLRFLLADFDPVA